MFAYTVRCCFRSADREDVAAEWLAWLKDTHIQDVLAAGAMAAEIVRMDCPPAELVYEIRYRFSSRRAFADYEAGHAARLRAEGLAAFPLSLGLSYERTTGEVVS